MTKPAKTPKRSFRTNIYGNTVGYEGGRRAFEFGCKPWAEKWAEAWTTGLSVEEAEFVALGVVETVEGKEPGKISTEEKADSAEYLKAHQIATLVAQGIAHEVVETITHGAGAVTLIERVAKVVRIDCIGEPVFAAAYWIAGKYCGYNIRSTQSDASLRAKYLIGVATMSMDGDISAKRV